MDVLSRSCCNYFCDIFGWACISFPNHFQDLVYFLSSKLLSAFFGASSNFKEYPLIVALLCWFCVCCELVLTFTRCCWLGLTILYFLCNRNAVNIVSASKTRACQQHSAYLPTVWYQSVFSNVGQKLGA